MRAANHDADLDARRARRPPVYGFVGVALLVLGVGLAPSVVLAGADSMNAFREHVANGAKLRKHGEHRQALAQFERARAIADHPKLMLVTGQLREATGDCAGARDDYRGALDDKRSSLKLRARLQVAIDKNRSCVSRGVLVVECSPEGARLAAGERAMACGEEVELVAGTHRLVASAEGFRDLEREVRVDPGGYQEETVSMTPVARAAAVPKWLTYSAYGGMGVGGALVLAGLVSDMTAPGRQEDLQQAHESGDLARTNRLIEEADSAQTRTAFFYTSGVLLAAAGTALWVYDDEAAGWLGVGADKPVQAGVSIGPTGAVVGARLRW